MDSYEEMMNILHGNTRSDMIDPNPFWPRPGKDFIMTGRKQRQDSYWNYMNQIAKKNYISSNRHHKKQFQLN